MSGTSLDGVDAAMVRTDGITIEAFGPSAYRPYSPDEQDTLRAALGQWPGDAEVQAAVSARAKSQFMGLLSRELRTPMNGVLAVAELLRHVALSKLN